MDNTLSRILLSLLLVVAVGGCQDELEELGLRSEANEAYYWENNRSAAQRVRRIMYGETDSGRYERFKIVHISDPHLSSWSGSNHYKLPINLRQSIRFANQQELRIDAIAATGDFISIEPKETAKDCMRSFVYHLYEENHVPTFLCTGNHDSNANEDIGDDFLLKHEINEILFGKSNYPSRRPDAENYYYADVPAPDGGTIRFIALDMLDRIAKLPHNQQTVKTIMRIASDRLRASVVITDAEYGILSEATWPRTETLGQEEVLSYIKDCSGGESFKETRRKGRPSWIYRAEIHTGDDSLMHLLAISEGGRIDPMLWKQAVEGVRLSMGVWGKDHGKVNLSELIRAIIQDEPIKMRRLGALYRIDVEAMSDVWIMKNMGVNNPEIWVEPLKKLSSHFVSVELCGLYDDDILIFPVGERTLRDMNDWAEALVEFFHEKNLNFRVTRCPMLQKTSAAKYAYEVNSAYLTDAMTIFPRRDYFTLSEIEFAGECRRIADAGKESAAECMSMLQPLIERRDGEEIIHTLQAYILDENSSTTRTAEALFVHKNTVKYRLQKAGDLLGFHIGDILQSRNLAYALAMQRMLGPA